MENKKRGKKTMWLILGIVAVVIIGIIIFFNIPYSKTKSEFNRVITEHISKTEIINDIFTENDIQELPDPVRKYFEYCGYIGTPKMSYMKAEFKNVNFMMSSKKLKIDYTQYNFVNEPIRIAFIDTTLYGIPFQGLDSFQNGIGGMKGVIGKLITLFDQKGKAMDKASLVTYLSECLIVPSVALQDFITWETIDDTHASATISYYGISTSGIFTFNEKGEMVEFTTNDREATQTDGTSQQVPWSAILQDYKEIGGIKQPTVFKAIWHYDDGDIVYFESYKGQIKYDCD